MKALETAAIYFGPFLIIGVAIKIAVARWTARHDIDLAGIQAQAGGRRRARRSFLLGAWRNEED